MTATEVHSQPITNASAWTRDDIAASDDWIHVLSDAEIADLDRALRAVHRPSVKLADITRADFPLPVLGPVLVGLEQDVRTGRGFFLLRGIPVERYSDDELFVLKWGIGTHLGRAISQNTYGDVLGHVFDHGAADPTATRTRGYQTSAGLDFHVARADMTSLLCLRQGRAGGISRIVSSMAVHNAILARHPEYLPPLYEGLPYIYTEAAGEMKTWNGPVFGVTDTVLSCSFRRGTIQKAIDSPGVTLPPLKAAALACIDEIMNDPALVYEMELMPGDIQFVNNYTVLHGRTAFTDDPDPDKKRHVVRLWLKFFTPRPASAYIRDQYKGIEKKLDANPAGFRTQ
ncbi:MAG: TauD/TfdA family dioxygenase [Alphaproteobacteria bacterium]|nr:TauD/TfdA family dioxygenase [Alphaproteobacteria bacterium]